MAASAKKPGELGKRECAYKDHDKNHGGPEGMKPLIHWGECDGPLWVCKQQRKKVRRR